MAFIAEYDIKKTINISGNPSTMANFCISFNPPTVDNPMAMANIAIAS